MNFRFNEIGPRQRFFGCKNDESFYSETHSRTKLSLKGAIDNISVFHNLLLQLFLSVDTFLNYTEAPEPNSDLNLNSITLR